jgi:hypothetical protein
LGAVEEEGKFYSASDQAVLSKKDVSGPRDLSWLSSILLSVKGRARHQETGIPSRHFEMQFRAAPFSARNLEKVLVF